MLQLYKIKKIKFQNIFITITVMMLFSCNLTKHLKDNEKLLVKNKVIIVDDDIDTKDPGFDEYEIKQAIKPKPNTKFISLPVNLWVYYLYEPEKIEKKVKRKNKRCNKFKKKRISRVSKKIRFFEKEIKNSEINSSKYNRYNKRLLNLQSRKGKKEDQDCNKLHWSQKVEEPPVLYKINDEYRNKRKIRVLLKNKGYYNPLIKVNSKSRKNNKKKITVNYKIIPGKPYIINKINYNIEDPQIKKTVLTDTANTLIKKGSRIDTKLIEIERKRISDKLRNAGYYKFSKDFIYFSVDTIGKKNLADITVNIKREKNENGEEQDHKKNYIKDVYIYPNYKPREALANKESYFLKNDTLIYYDKNGMKYHFLYNNVPVINPKAIVKGLYISPDKLFNVNDINATYRYLAAPPIILIANVQFKENHSQTIQQDSVDYLDCEIKLTQDKLQGFDYSTELTNTVGNIGIAANINYTHNNIFRNTEILDLKLNFALKRITKSSSYDVITDSLGFFNSFEYGFDIGFKFPRLVAPLPFKKFIKRSNPKTLINAKYNYLKEPGYSTSVVGMSFGYSWYSTNTLSHAFTPITSDFVRLIDPAESFIDWIREKQLEESYEDHFVFGSSYRFTFNNQLYSQKKNFIYLTTYSKLVGNSLSGLMQLFNQEKINGSYMIADNVFAQFIKNEVDIRYYRKLSREKDMLVFRFFAGVAFPYGNLNVIPFTEQYFSGGANGIRAWQERSLGPGSYVETNTDRVNIYPRQRSDMKLEGNLEYRMKLFWRLEGALFIDAGNIWAINDLDIREGAMFEFNGFYNEIAVGTGFGLRLDFDFVVIRFDLGRKLLDPGRLINHRLVLAGHDNIKDIWAVNLGIGYPF